MRKQGIREELANLQANIQKTEDRLYELTSLYADAPCCPSCGILNSSEHSQEYKILIMKQGRRDTRVQQIRKKIKDEESRLSHPRNQKG